MSALVAGLSMGAAVRKTMSAVSPDFEGNVACKMSEACCEGVLPAVNLFSKWVPTTWERTVMPMMARTQRASTVRRRS